MLYEVQVRIEPVQGTKFNPQYNKKKIKIHGSMKELRKEISRVRKKSRWPSLGEVRVQGWWLISRLPYFSE